MEQLKKLKEKWLLEKIETIYLVNIEEIQKFQHDNNVVIPNDMTDYFISLNGTGGEYTDELYEFYSLNRIQKVIDEFKDWEGIPNYRDLFDFNEIKGLYVFANFSFNLFAYAIKFSSDASEKSEVYVLSGGEYKKIADSFSEFLEMYLNDSKELQLNKE